MTFHTNVFRKTLVAGLLSCLVVPGTSVSKESTEAETTTSETTASGEETKSSPPGGAGVNRDEARARFDRDSQGMDANDPTAGRTLGLTNPSPTQDGEEYAGGANIQNPVVGVVDPMEEAAPVTPTQELGDRMAAVINPGDGSTNGQDGGPSGVINV